MTRSHFVEALLAKYGHLPIEREEFPTGALWLDLTLNEKQSLAIEITPRDSVGVSLNTLGDGRGFDAHDATFEDFGLALAYIERQAVAHGKQSST